MEENLPSDEDGIPIGEDLDEESMLDVMDKTRMPRLRRTFSLGHKRYRNHEVRYVIQEYERLERENCMYRRFMTKFLSSRGVKISNKNLIIGDKNTLIDTENAIGMMETLTQDMIGLLAKQALELEQIKNVLVVLQGDVQALTDVDEHVMDRLNRVQEFLEVEVHPERRPKRFAAGMSALQKWSKELTTSQQCQLTFKQIPEKAKPLLNYMAAKYGNFKETLKTHFGVTGVTVMDGSTHDYFARVLTVWVNCGQRNVTNLELVFAKLEEYSLEEKKQDQIGRSDLLSDEASSVTGSTNTTRRNAEILIILYQVLDKQDETLKLLTRIDGQAISREQSLLQIQEQHFV